MPKPAAVAAGSSSAGAQSSSSSRRTPPAIPSIDVANTMKELMGAAAGGAIR